MKPAPATAEPPEPAAPGPWLARNGSYLLVAAGLVALAWYKFGFDGMVAIAIAAAGLGLVIFIHELGHFLVAKWCDVHVQTFSIGFGPALPGCQFQYGETTYKIALFPLGGYVKMVGEGFEDEGEDDPRSFKNKPVWQRMAIISAGVTMNLLLAFACFVFVFRTHGDKQIPGVVGRVEPGSPAWKLGVRPGYVIEAIGSESPHPSFEDLRMVVMNSYEGEPIRLVCGPPGNEQWLNTSIVPRKETTDPGPMIGIAPPPQLRLLPAKARKGHDIPVSFGSAAAAAQPPFEFDDEVIATTDPDHPDRVTDLPADPRNPKHRDYFEYERRMQRLAGRPVTVRVHRKGEAALDVHVPPAFHAVLGLRMRMGKVAAVRADSPAARAGVKKDDIIDQVEVVSGGGKVRFASARGSQAAAPGGRTEALDPVRLPHDLARWAAGQPGAKTVTIRVLRANADAGAGGGHDELRPETLRLDWDEAWSDTNDEPFSQPSPQTIPELGLAYKVETVVEAVEPGSPAARARVLKAGEVKFAKGDVIKDREGKVVHAADGEKVRVEEGYQVNLRAGDIVQAYQFYTSGRSAEDVPVAAKKWTELKGGDWAHVFRDLQAVEAKQVNLRLDRDQLEVVLHAEPADQGSARWPLADRGLLFMTDSRLVKADSLGQALGMGARKTKVFIQQIFGNLRGIVTNRLSTENFGGPILIATAAFQIAGDDIYQFIVFLGIIGVNLAVINFMPIPVLDGGHMVFLIYERLRGRPAPEQIRVAATYVGLAFIVCLMLFVFYLDFKRVTG